MSFWLIAGTLLVLLLLWSLRWWLKRHHPEYPFAERAAVIARALRQQSDITVVYWSRNKMRYIERTVTPKAQVGRVLTAYDPVKGRNRTFKITRIKRLTLATDATVRTSESAAVPALAKLWPLLWLTFSTVGLIMLFVAVQRTRRDPTVKIFNRAFWLARPAGGLPVTATSSACSAVQSAFPLPLPPVIAPRPDSVPIHAGVTIPRPGQRDTALDYFKRATARTKPSEWSDALDDYSSAIRHSPFFAEAYVGRARLKFLQGEFPSALRDGQQAIESKPYQAEGFTICGAVLVAQGEWDNALTNLNKAIELNPGDPAAFCIRAWARCKTGERLGAIQDAEIAARLAPTSGGALYTRAAVKYGSGDPGGAVIDCTQALKLDGAVAAPHVLRGLIHFDANEFDRALAEWTTAVTADASLKQPLAPWLEKARNRKP